MTTPKDYRPIHSRRYVQVGAAAAHMLLSEQSPTLYGRQTEMVSLVWDRAHVREVFADGPASFEPYRNAVV